MHRKSREGLLITIYRRELPPNESKVVAVKL